MFGGSCITYLFISCSPPYLAPALLPYHPTVSRLIFTPDTSGREDQEMLCMFLLPFQVPGLSETFLRPSAYIAPHFFMLSPAQSFLDMVPLSLG